jgi:5-methylcytosine-specific restriction endonuclease McrA
MRQCPKCRQPEIPYHHNRCHSCYLILRRKWYARKKPNYSKKQWYRNTGHYVWIAGLLHAFKRKRSKNNPKIVEPSSQVRKKLAKKLEKLLKSTFKCPYTNEKLVLGKNVSLDHKIPLSRRPDLAYTYSNLAWVSKSYNKHKSDMTNKEFLKFCQNIVNRATKT